MKLLDSVKRYKLTYLTALLALAFVGGSITLLIGLIDRVLGF